MPPPVQASRWRHYVVSMCPSVRLLLMNTIFWKTNELILMQIGTSCPRSKGMRRSSFGVMRSKFKVTQGRNRSQNAFGEISQRNIRRILTKSAVTYHGKRQLCHDNSDAKGQRPQWHEAAWRRHHSLWSFSSPLGDEEAFLVCLIFGHTQLIPKQSYITNVNAAYDRWML